MTNHYGAAIMNVVRDEIPQHRRAIEGHIWQCGACGKTAEDHYGLIGEHSPGWDESCMLNAVQVPRKETLND